VKLIVYEYSTFVSIVCYEEHKKNAVKYSLSDAGLSFPKQSHLIGLSRNDSYVVACIKNHRMGSVAPVPLSTQCFLNKQANKQTKTEILPYWCVSKRITVKVKNKKTMQCSLVFYLSQTSVNQGQQEQKVKALPLELQGRELLAGTQYSDFETSFKTSR